MMSHTLRRSVQTLVLLAAAVVWMTTSVSGQKPSTANGEWPHYTADEKGTKYSPLDQIDASNFDDLEVAWRFKTDNFGPRPEFKLEGTPLMIDGVLYTTAGTRRSAIAMDAKTGELLWSHTLHEGLRGGLAPRQLSGRGLAYWTDGQGDNRVLYFTPGYRLIGLRAETGVPVESFGESGIVDLKVGVKIGSGEQIDLVTGEIGLHSTPLIAKDRVIVGSSFREGMTVETHNNTKGIVRAYDVRTGELDWTFNTMPGPGEFGNETWEDGSWAENGNTGVWTEMTVDEELGIVYLPVETPTSDFYGGHRPGDNLFGESLVAVSLETGERLWHFQLVHHPIWNFDNSSAPILADITVDGQEIKAVALPSKQAFLYVFDRETGVPVWPIVETPVPQSIVPGEKTSPTQPIPTKPPPFARNYLDVPDDVIDYTPDLRKRALQHLENFVWEPSPFNPQVVGVVDGVLGAITGGTAVNWPGGGYDPETQTFYAVAGNSPGRSRSIASGPEGHSDIAYLLGTEGAPFRMAYAAGTGQNPDATGRGARTMPPAFGGPGGGGARPPGTAIEGLPIVKPPYGILTAVDVNRGEIKFQVPHGDTPDDIRNHPLLEGLDIPKTGQGGSMGVLVTKTLVIAGDGQVTTTREHPRGAMLRAYDKETGEQVGAVWMPAPQSGSPMTYMVDGEQYIVVAISGGPYSGEYLAFKVPE